MNIWFDLFVFSSLSMNFNKVLIDVGDIDYDIYDYFEPFPVVNLNRGLVISNVHVCNEQI
jgi:hypothetical protein